MPNNTVDVQCRLRPAIRPAPCHPRRADVPAGPGKLPRLTQALALALRFDDMVRSSEARDFADVARLACLSRARISQVLKLLWLAPEIQREILYLPRTPGGRYPISEVAARRITREPSWQRQRVLWDKLKQDKHLA